MSDPFSGTGLAGLALTGASVYGLLTGTDYGVVFGAFAGAVFYIATAADLSVLRRLAYFVVSYIVGILGSGLVGSKLASWTEYVRGCWGQNSHPGRGTPRSLWMLLVP